MMAAIGPTDTKPELAIRRGLHALGYRFRLGRSWRRDGRLLPGRPDLVFPGWKAVIMIHGCFWHGHDCALFRWPATRPEFWRDKLGGNITRDIRVREALLDYGWRVLEIWECNLKGRQRQPLPDVLAACAKFLGNDEAFRAIGSDTRVNPADSPPQPAATDDAIDPDQM